MIVETLPEKLVRQQQKKCYHHSRYLTILYISIYIKMLQTFFGPTLLLSIENMIITQKPIDFNQIFRIMYFVYKKTTLMHSAWSHCPCRSFSPKISTRKPTRLSRR